MDWIRILLSRCAALIHPNARCGPDEESWRTSNLRLRRTRSGAWRKRKHARQPCVPSVV